MIALPLFHRPRDRGASGSARQRFVRRQRLGRLTVGLAGLGSAALVLFHLGLLWQRVADQSLTEPTVLTRWLASVFLLGALVYLRRAGVPVLWGRRALVFWLLVLVLHVGIPAAGAVPAGGHAPGSGVLLVLPAALPVLAATLLLAIGLGRRVAVERSSARRRPRVPDPLRRPRSGHAPSILSRPPPVPVRL